MSVPFAFDPTPDLIARNERFHPFDRARVARDAGSIVATFGSDPFDLTIPGAAPPTSGVTGVTVLPTHRRQGILRRLMLDHFDDCRRRDEPLAALWASESQIYGRFGFGLATRRYNMKLRVETGMFARERSHGFRFRLVDVSAARNSFPAIYNAERPRRPGMFSRDELWWESILLDPADRREGWSPQQRVVVSRAGVDVAYALYRTRWNDDGKQKLRLSDAFAVDADAEHALWTYLTSVDLVVEVEKWNDPLDRPYDDWLVNPRLAKRTLGDALRVRLVDVATSLSQRLYQGSGRLNIAVGDVVCPWNDATYALEADGGATCAVTSDDADVAIDVSDLARLMLGDVTVLQLARLGKISGSDDDLLRANGLFRWDGPAPYCQEMF